MVFVSREDAGRELGKYIVGKGLDVDLVLAVPRGGLPVGRKVADVLGIGFDVVVGSKVGAPGNPELGIGAVASDGSYWLNNNLVKNLDVDESYLDKEIRDKARVAGEKLRFMRGTSELPEVEGKKVLVVDDGVATGGTAIACLRQLKNAGVGEVFFAAPVGPESVFEKLGGEADKVFVLETPRFFGSVGSHYRDFTQVTDEEAKEYLNKKT